MKRVWILALFALAGAVGAFSLYRFDPSTSALFPPCPFHALTGLHCPGCGSLRAFHALLHGDVARAAAFNPLITLVAPFLLAGTVREGYRLTAGKDRLDLRMPAWSILALAAVIVTFGVLRNLPGFSWLAPH